MEEFQDKLPASEPPEPSDMQAPQPAVPSPPLHSSRKKLVITGAVLAIVVIAAASFWMLKGNKKTDTPQALTKVSVRLEWLNGPEFTGMYVAQDKGFYKAEGLDVNLKEFTDGTDLNKEVAAGQVDYGVSTPLEVILARDKGQKNKAIAAVMQTSPYTIAARKDANIKSPSDFKGKVLGNIGDNNEAMVTYAVLLANAGLKPTDATVKTVDYDVVKALGDHQADTADIYRSDQSFLLDQAKVPYDLINPELFGFNIYGDILITSDKKITENPGQTGAFVRATMKGWQYAVDHQTETLSILAKHRNSFYNVPGYDKFSLEATVPLIKPVGNQPIGSMQYVPWNRAVEGIKIAGLDVANIDVTDVYTSQFVK